MWYRSFVYSLFLILVLVNLSCNRASLKGNNQKDKAAGSENTDESSLYVIDPGEQTVEVGKTAEFSLKDSEGNVVSSNATWSVLESELATSLGNGKFSTNDIGTTTVTASINGVTKQASLVIVRPDTLEDSTGYTRLVYGIENCIDGEFDKTAKRQASPCLGDCDDAWVIIDADLTLGRANGKYYIVSNKDQDLTIGTYAGSWKIPTSPEGDDNISAENSKLIVKIKDKAGKEISSKTKSLIMRIRNGVNDNPFGGPDGSPLQKEVIHVNKWEAIDIQSKFVGSAIDSGNCKATSKLTKSKDGDEGYYRRDRDMNDSECPSNVLDANDRKILCCDDWARNVGHCSISK